MEAQDRNRMEMEAVPGAGLGTESWHRLLTVTREPPCCSEAWRVPHGAAGLFGALPGAM